MVRGVPTPSPFYAGPPQAARAGYLNSYLYFYASPNLVLVILDIHASDEWSPSPLTAWYLSSSLVSPLI